jgi:hypothetical protein
MGPSQKDWFINQNFPKMGFLIALLSGPLAFSAGSHKYQAQKYLVCSLSPLIFRFHPLIIPIIQSLLLLCLLDKAKDLLAPKANSWMTSFLHSFPRLPITSQPRLVTHFQQTMLTLVHG